MRYIKRYFKLIYFVLIAVKSPVILTVSRPHIKMQRSSSISVGTPSPSLAQRGGITAPFPVDVRISVSARFFFFVSKWQIPLNHNCMIRNFNYCNLITSFAKLDCSFFSFSLSLFRLHAIV